MLLVSGIDFLLVVSRLVCSSLLQQFCLSFDLLLRFLRMEVAIFCCVGVLLGVYYWLHESPPPILIGVGFLGIPLPVLFASILMCSLY